MLATNSYVAVDAEREARLSENVNVRSQQRVGTNRTVWDRVSLFGCIVVCAMVGWFLASSAAGTAGANQEINQLQTQIQQAKATNASYTTQLARLTQPSRILSVALGPLHMKYANPVVIRAASTGAN